MGLVLVVDEEECEAVLGAAVLRYAGHQPLLAASMEQAVAILAETPIDLLFTEIAMQSDIHGGLVLAHRAVQLQPAVPVLYTTGRGVTYEMRSRFVPRFGFIGKPYGAKDLIRAVANALMPLRKI
ncbi:MAG: response regulator [Bradyrhizobiaceae bacterium]|nr:response regulator [Bradyrhizobiaceae bacterium]